MCIRDRVTNSHFVYSNNWSDVQIHTRSLLLAPFDRSHIIFYYYSIVAACTVVQAVVLYKQMANEMGEGNFHSPQVGNHRPILTKRKTYNYRPKTTHEAKRHFDPTTFSQFATVRNPRLFRSLRHPQSACTAGQISTIHASYHMISYRRRCTFGFCWYLTQLMGQIQKKTNHGCTHRRF